MLVLEAIVCLAVARFVVLRLPFRRYSAWIGEQGLESRPTDSDTAAPGRVGWALGLASRRMWWDCNCLTQALAGTALLRRRGIPSTLYLGLQQTDPGGLRAHAWLRSGDQVVTGAEGRENFAVIACFSQRG